MDALEATKEDRERAEHATFYALGGQFEVFELGRADVDAEWEAMLSAQ